MVIEASQCDQHASISKEVVVIEVFIEAGRQLNLLPRLIRILKTMN